MTIKRRSRPLVHALLMAVVLVFSHVAFALFDGLFDPVSARAGDRLFALRSHFDWFRPHYDDTVVQVDIDDYSREQLGVTRLGRGDLARVVGNLQRAAVAAQFHDVIFVDTELPDSDRELVEATRGADNVYYGIALGPSSTASAVDSSTAGAAPHVSLERSRWHPRIDGDPRRIPRSTHRFLTFAELAGVATGLGFLDITVDSDGVFRRVPLLVRDGDGVIPSLSLRVVSDYLGVDPRRILVRPGESITLPDARRPGAPTTADIVIPLDREGNLIVNYIGPRGTMTHYPFATIYRASDDRFELEDLRAELEGKIVLVAWAASGVGDIGAVPVEPTYPLSGIHANVMHSILTGEFIHLASLPFMLLAIEVPLLALLFLARQRLATLAFVLVPPVLVAAYVAIAAAAFIRFRWLLDIPGPIFIIALSTLAISAYDYHREATARAVLRQNFNAYFPPSVVEKVMRHPAVLETACHKQELTILFSDIRDFTHHSSTMEPAHVRDLLNEYFGKMVDVVFEHGGTLDKFIGDGMMVFFGDPEPQADHAARAVRAAVAMQRAARRLDVDWRRRGRMPLEIRIGINSGEVIVGNMGSARRLAYTALGGAVNLAQRLESAAPPGGILISARTRELAGDAVPLRPVAPIRVRGVDEAVEAFEVSVPPSPREKQEGPGE